MDTAEQVRNGHITGVMKAWREGTLSDVEALYAICAYLPSGPMTDLVVEVVGKMYQEEVAEWPNPDEREAIADMIHGPEGVISEAKTLEQAGWDVEPLSDEVRQNFTDEFEPNR